MNSRRAASGSHPEPLTTGSSSLALLASMLWGGNMVTLKLGLTVFPPFWSAWWRFALGLVVVGIWARLYGVDLNPHRRERKQLATLAVLFAAQIVLLNTAMDLTSPAYGVVLINAHPIFSNLIGHYVSTEQKLTRKRVLGLALAFGGVCYLALGRPVESLASNPLLGNSMLVLSALLLGIRTVYTRWIVQSIAPIRAVTWQMLGSLPFFLIPALLLEAPATGPVTAAPVLAIVYQGAVIAGFCFIIWTTLLRRHSAGTLAMFGFAVPFFGILASAWMFQEPVTGRILLAACLVTAGIAVVTYSGTPSRAE